jgi:hypothetical protein
MFEEKMKFQREQSRKEVVNFRIMYDDLQKSLEDFTTNQLKASLKREERLNNAIVNLGSAENLFSAEDSLLIEDKERMGSEEESEDE